MKLVLSTIGRSFATRLRARELVVSLVDAEDRAITLDATAVAVSPSFLAESLMQLAKAGKRITVIVDDPSTERLAHSLVGHLHLESQVSVEAGAIPA